MKNETDAGVIGQPAKHGGADAGHAKGKAEENSGDEPDPVGNQFLGVNQNGGKGGGKDKADDGGEHAAPREAGVGKQEGERRHAEDGSPDHHLAAQAVAHRTADERAGGDTGEKNKKMNLGVPHTEVEFIDEIEGVVVADAGEIDEL